MLYLLGEREVLIDVGLLDRCGGLLLPHDACARGLLVLHCAPLLSADDRAIGIWVVEILLSRCFPKKSTFSRARISLAVPVASTPIARQASRRQQLRDCKG